jgi:hypothetical protein
MSEERPEGFPKPGTTLEGRVANLFRLMGYNVSRNIFIEGHEVDVYAEKEDENIMVECKEYYTQRISRDLILIFNTKVRDIRPSEAWFVTINDFDSSSRELCNRYGIRAVNGFLLEEFEDSAIKKIGEVEFGDIPREDRILRRLRQRMSELSKEKRRTGEIRRVIDQISELRVQHIELAPYFMPASESDLEEKYIWLSEMHGLPKITEEGFVQNIIVNVLGAPLVRGFRIVNKMETSLYLPSLVIMWIVSIAAIYNQLELYYLVIPLALSGVFYYYREEMVYKTERIINRKTSDAIFESDRIVLQVAPEQFVDDMADYAYPDLVGLDMHLIDDTFVGVSNDFIVEKKSWLIRGIQVQLNQEYTSEIGDSMTVIPVRNAEFSFTHGKKEIKIKALYVLDDSFLMGKKQL